MNVREGGKNLLVVIIGSLGVNPGFVLVNNTDAPGIVDEFERAYTVMKSLPADVPLGSHPAMYNLSEKYPKIGSVGPNPFIDPLGYKMELNTVERVYRAALQEQRKAAAK
jgi:metallo-beta-lactamase class B